MALNLALQNELATTQAFRERVKIAAVQVANGEWFAINRAPVGTDPVPAEGIMTNKDALIFNYAVRVMNNPDDFVQRFAYGVANDTSIKDGFNDIASVLADANIDSILVSAVTALFPRFAGASQWGIANN